MNLITHREARGALIDCCNYGSADFGRGRCTAICWIKTPLWLIEPPASLAPRWRLLQAHQAHACLNTIDKLASAAQTQLTPALIHLLLAIKFRGGHDLQLEHSNQDEVSHAGLVGQVHLRFLHIVQIIM